MHKAIENHHTRDSEKPPTCLLDILHNPLLLANIVPYLPVTSILHLAATNKAFRHLLYQTPGVFRHLDLTRVRTAQLDTTSVKADAQSWRNSQLDEDLTEDDFYSGPLRNILSSFFLRNNLLHNVQTLILDGLSITSDLCHEIINDPAYNVRILSIRDVKNLNQGKLRGSLTYACRPSRPEGTPKLKGLYLFGPKEAVPLSKPASTDQSSIGTGWNQRSQETLTSSLQQEPDSWWSKKGKMITRPKLEDWVSCLLACKGIIAFDAVMCRGPRHSNSPTFGRPSLPFDHTPAVATFALSGCAGCGKAPEGVTENSTGCSASRPVLAPPPILLSSIRAATTPQQRDASFVARCSDCIKDRYCSGCEKWWCESCYQLPGQAYGDYIMIGDDDGIQNSVEDIDPEFMAVKFQARISRSCWECGTNCHDCIEKTQKTCKKCCAGYCITHNEGSCTDFCDWCVSRGRNVGQQKSQGFRVSQFPPLPIERRRRM